jgi:predicted nuclease with TOPRIM domain
MIKDARVRRLQREVAEGERLLRELQGRQNRDPAVRESCSRLQAAVARRKAQLKRRAGSSMRLR